MCNVSNKIKFCTCATTSPEKLRHYWVLHRFNKDKEFHVMGMPYFPDEELYLFDHEKNKMTLEARLNEQDAFDFETSFKQKDRFEIVLNNHLFEQQRVTYYFNYSKGKWRIDDADCYFDTMNNYDEVQFGKFKDLRQ